MARLRLLSGGESHGPKITVIVDGLPAGLRVDRARVTGELQRRQLGYGRGYRMRSIERDEAIFTGGLRFGETMGGPLVIEIPNLDHDKWRGVMEVDPIADHQAADARAIRRPRPGHADLAGALKYDRHDLRDVLERASARNTTARVAAGAVARALLAEIGVEIFSLVTKIGGVEWPLPERDLESFRGAAEASDVRCPDAATAERMRQKIDEAQKAGDTVGGSFAVIATGVPPGLGSYAEWDRKLDGRLAQAVMSIPAVKAVEIGAGVQVADRWGSQAHDPIDWRPEGDGGRFVRPTNHAGGLEGGVSNGAELIVRGSMKPISTLAQPLRSVNLDDKTESLAAYERSDVCAVPACAVIAEAAVAFCLADAALESYGGDTIGDLRATFRAVKERQSRL